MSYRPWQRRQRHQRRQATLLVVLFCPIIALMYLPLTQSPTTHLKLIETHDSPMAQGLDAFSTPQQRQDNTKKKTLQLQQHHEQQQSMDRGGLIIFLHIPKTGGTTIRDTLASTNASTNINYWFVSGAGIYNRTKPHLEYYLHTKTKRKRNVFVLEIHGRDSPHLLQLYPTLQSYREMARQRNLPIFFFTILRDPIPYALSYFNFFHVQRKSSYFDNVLPTESNLLRYSLYNPQCQFLARGEFSLRNHRKKQQPTWEECHRVQQVLLETMDWVGTTERMNMETLPLLRRVLLGGGDDDDEEETSTATSKRDLILDFVTTRVSSKAQNVSIALTDLSPMALMTLQNMSTMDTNLYQSIPQHYDYNQVSNLWKAPPPPPFVTS